MEKQNLNSNGSCSIDGGEYGEVRVSASLKVRESLCCSLLHCSGSVKIQENLECEGKASCSASGSFAVGGSLTCKEKLGASGSVRVGGSLQTETGTFSGSCSVGGDLHGGTIICSGAVRVGRGVEAESFRSTGMLDIGGLLNAERVEISVGSKGTVADIGGGSIVVRRDHNVFSFGGAGRCLHTGTIEGDEIELEATEAEVVRGKTVRIEKGCKIGRVEYSERCDAADGTVGECVRI